MLKAWLANSAVRLLRGDWDPGVLDADVQMMARRTVNLGGTYSVEARSALLKAWWRDPHPSQI